jgi:hypothetical protein
VVRLWRLRDLTVIVAGFRAVMPPYVALMMVEPLPTPVTRPAASPLVPTVAIAWLSDVQLLRVVTSWVAPLKLEVTVKRALVPAVSDPAVSSVLVVKIAMDKSCGAVTVRVVGKVNVPDGAFTVAVTVVVPVSALALSNTRFPLGAVTVARAGLSNVH